MKRAVSMVVNEKKTADNGLVLLLKMNADQSSLQRETVSIRHEERETVQKQQPKQK